MNGSPILVGYDGSPQAEAALDWTLDEAGRQAAPVRLVYVYEWTSAVAPVAVECAWSDPAARHDMQEAIDKALTEARATRPGLDISGVVLDGMVISLLRQLSADARLLVVGSRGLGGFNGLLAGSVAVGVAAHAHCPMVVVRGVAAPRRPIVVGLDECRESDHVLAFAFEQAAERGVDLVAVRAWQPPPMPWHTDVRPLSSDIETLTAAQRQLAVDAVQPWQEKYTQVTATIRIMPSAPAHALITASYDAQLVVVGARGRGGFRGLLLGSVARQLIHHSSCPVAVVREESQPPFPA